jgi:hypothetical protein
MGKTSRPAEAPIRSRTTKPSTSMSIITDKGRARGNTNPSTIGAEKKKNNNHTQSSGFGSDMSTDECDETPTKPNNGQRSSVVHDFATKTSPNEYRCNICTKVG